MKLQVKQAQGIKKLIGLMGLKKPIPLYFKTRFGVHTFGLQFPIDVIVLDNTNKVVKLKKNLQQNRIFIWNPIHFHVIELPHGTIDKNNIELGKHLTLLHV